MAQLVGTNSYSAIVEAKLRAESVFTKLFNNRHEVVAGAVNIPVRAEANVANYTISTGATLNSPTTTYVPIVCDKDYAVNELIDGFVAAAVSDNMVAERLDSAGFAFADKADTDLAALCATDGTALSSTTKLTTSSIYAAIVDAVQAAAALKVKKSEMWLAVSNETYGTLIKSTEFIQAAGSTADLGNGYMGTIAGIPVYETANLPAKTEFVLGNSVYCHYVPLWRTEPKVVDLADGAHIGSSAVQGRMVCGYKISKTNTVLVKKTA